MSKVIAEARSRQQVAKLLMSPPVWWMLNGEHPQVVPAKFIGSKLLSASHQKTADTEKPYGSPVGMHALPKPEQIITLMLK